MGGIQGAIGREVRLSAAALRHRGPDDSGNWVSHPQCFQVILIDHRLSVVDLSLVEYQVVNSKYV